MMKTSKISALRGALVASLMLGAAAAVAAPASDTQTLTVAGTVSSSLTLSIAQEANTFTDLPMAHDAANGQKVKVAVLTASTNNSTGLTYSVSSSALQNGDSATPIAVTPALAATDTLKDSVSFGANADTAASQAAGEFQQALWISYAPAAVQDPGAYSATLSVTVTDN